MTELLEKLSGIEGAGLQPEGDLSAVTGFRTGGRAAICTPLSRDSFIAVMDAVKKSGVPFRVLGNGTNTLARDEGYEGVVIRTQNAFRELSVIGGKVTAGAGLSLSAACRAALAASLTGMEFAYGIPGSIGGAVYMNAGAYDGEIKDIIDHVTVYDCSAGELRELDRESLDLSYRHSSLHVNRDLVVTDAVFCLEEGRREDIKAKMDELMGRRKDKQPLEWPSCGSTFKRPEGAYAAKLIQDCGLKGYTVGGARVSEKHSGFVINGGGATSADIFAVIDHVQKKVKEDTGYLLECEIEVL